MERTLQKRINSDGSWITVDLYGDPDQAGLVVVPGVMSDAHGWRHVVQAIRAWPSVAVVNRRGRAPSGPLTAEYSLQSEIDDLFAAIGQIGGAAAVFGWSYGGLIALLAADQRPLPQVIAYEPVSRPFGHDSLPHLKEAHDEADWDQSVVIVNRRISNFPESRVAELRDDTATWEALLELSKPLYPEIQALNGTALPAEIARQAGQVDLILGQANKGAGPYGTAFDDVLRRVPGARVHELPEQGHLAHIEAPAALAEAIDRAAAGALSGRSL